jgi:hypothetical protein
MLIVVKDSTFRKNISGGQPIFLWLDWKKQLEHWVEKKSRFPPQKLLLIRSQRNEPLPGQIRKEALGNSKPKVR